MIFFQSQKLLAIRLTSSLGLILLWDVDGGLTQIDKFLYSPEDHIKAGAILACGVVNAGVRNECDPALALLSDYILHDTMIMRVGAIFGLGLAYAGSNRNTEGDVLDKLLRAFTDEKSTMEVTGVAALPPPLAAAASPVKASFLRARCSASAARINKGNK